MTSGKLRRLTAFSTDPLGGNPAGVWIGPALPDSNTMQGIANEVGFSETAFLAPDSGSDRVIRYFSPQREIPFCGHATIAAGVALGESDGDGIYHLATPVGEVPVTTQLREGVREASLTSVPPRQGVASNELIREALSCLGWEQGELDNELPPARIYAGAWHLLLAVSSPDRLAALEYDFERLKSFMLKEELTTLQLVWRESPDVFHSRNPFPVGGIVEDPATGAAAAALGGYLRARGLVTPPCTILVRQGERMGRPSRITVGIPPSGGVLVTGAAVAI
jgi:PhzF family phenazine biosynthesis protein